MRPRFLICLTVLLVALVTFPLTVTAATKNTAKIKSTSYVDLMGEESFPLCGQYTFVDTVASYSGSGPELSGTGTGTLQLSISGQAMSFTGQVSSRFMSATIEGQTALICSEQNAAIVAGVALIVTSRDVLCGVVIGSLNDGVQPNQGRFEWTISGVKECSL